MNLPLPPHLDDRERLRRAIADDQERLRSAWRDLGQVVRKRTDVSRYARTQPYRWLGGAFIVGLVFGLARKG